MEPFKILTSIEAVDSFTRQHTLSFLYISQPNCSVCVGLQPQIARMLKNFPEIEKAEINTQEVPEIAGHLSIFTVPVLLLFVNGKEYIREARIVHTDALYEKIAHLYENRLNLD